MMEFPCTTVGAGRDWRWCPSRSVQSHVQGKGAEVRFPAERSLCALHSLHCGILKSQKACAASKCMFLLAFAVGQIKVILIYSTRSL